MTRSPSQRTTPSAFSGIPTVTTSSQSPPSRVPPATSQRLCSLLLRGYTRSTPAFYPASASIFAEDLVTAAFKVEAQVSITNLATHSRKIPESAFLVVDAFCWSGRGHHHYPLPEGHDPRIGEHVELIEHFDLAPFLANECWGCSGAEENWNRACLESRQCICVRACANMSLEHAKQLLRNSKDFAAFCHVGGDREGLRVTRGPYQGQLLAHGSVIFFKDGFRYWFGGCSSKQKVTTITKEPKMMRSA